MARVLSALVAFLLLPCPGMAIVNMENLHLGQPQDGFSGKIVLSSSGASGNTEKSDVAVGTRLQWHKQKITDVVVLDYSRGSASGARYTDKGFFHFRHIHQLTPRAAAEGFLQAEQNEFTRLEFRGLAGGGARFSLGRHSAARAMFFGAGIFHVTETLAEQPGLTDDGTEKLSRANMYFVIKYQFNKQTKFLSSTYYQPAFGSSSDYRIFETVSLSVNLAKHLALKLGLEVVHDSQPPQAIENTDISYRTGISYEF